MKAQKKPIAQALALSSLSAALLLATPLAFSAIQEHTDIHDFSVNDLLITFKGRAFGSLSTFSESGIRNWPGAICDIAVAGSPACPAYEGAPTPYTSKIDNATMLYPVNSKFGFEVFDFLGAEEKKVGDFIYEEGFIGDIAEGGVMISNAETATYKVRAPMGTWCQGLGGNTVKCSTEHYSVMEHVLSCNEVIPYHYWDFDLLAQQIITSAELGSFNCADAALDDNLLIVNTETRLTSADPIPLPGGQMEPNENSVIVDIAVSADYSLTLKDDGKPLYRWGTLIKRPNDIRLYANLDLPSEWKAEGVNYNVTKAELHIDHLITNNPNDQVRPEDLENEGATGRTPSYQVDGDNWIALKDCYEGDGDFIEGGVTLYKNAAAALDRDAQGSDPGEDPFAFSSDLTEGLTNGYYTSTDRDPFDWSYVSSGAVGTGTFDFKSFEDLGYTAPLTEAEMISAGVVLVSGPRWRLKPNKFGQDVPGLEIPATNCAQPPYAHGDLKYATGEPVTTVINLLDWDEEGEGAPSPLATTSAWVDVDSNEFVEVAGYQLKSNVEGGVPYSTNGLPMTDNFDLAVYVKGDSKPTALYSVRLVVEWDDVAIVAPE